MPGAEHDSNADLGRAMRIGFVVFASIFAFFAFRLAFSISYFELMYADMLSGKPLPLITTFAISGRYLWMALSILLPLTAVGFAVLARRHTTAILGISISALLLFVQSFLLWVALWNPMTTIINGLSSGN